tara:strand:- start:72 stop:425 length:354 start_codon:yes stop_codon:yes gene_type:complete
MITEAIKLLRPGSSFSVTGQDYSKIKWCDPNNTMPTLQEVNNKIAELQALEPMRLLRVERNKLLAETDWRMVKDYKGTDQSSWETYRQALRDLPTTANPQLDEQGNLTNITWPEKSE